MRIAEELLFDRPCKVYESLDEEDYKIARERKRESKEVRQRERNRSRSKVRNYFWDVDVQKVDLVAGEDALSTLHETADDPLQLRLFDDRDRAD